MIAGDWIEAMALVLCRVGGCLMIAAGYSGARVPVPARLLLAIAISLAVLPLVEALLRPSLVGGGPVVFIRAAAGEMIVGLGLGLVTRVFLLALEFTAEVVGQAIGLANSPRPGIEGEMALSPLSDLLVLTGLMIVIASGLHLEALRALIDSYDVFIPGRQIDPARHLGDLARVLTAAFRVALQIAAPFVLFGVVANLLLGLATRMLPQVPMQFVGGPLLLVGGFALLGTMLIPAMAHFAVAVARAIAR